MLDTRIRLGSAGVMLPHYSAYKVAEAFRVLEALAPGRIDLGAPTRATQSAHLNSRPSRLARLVVLALGAAREVLGA